MDFKIPNKLTIGSIDYKIIKPDQINENEDFGCWNCLGYIKIAQKIGGKPVSIDRQKQTFWHELTHAILH